MRAIPSIAPVREGFGQVTPTSFSVTSPAPRAAWHEILATDSSVLRSQTPEWLDTVCEVGGWEDASRLYTSPSGRRLILPMVARRLANLTMVEQSLPVGWGFGGLVGMPTLEEVEGVCEDLARRRVMLQSLRPNMLQGEIWSRALAGRGAQMVLHRGHAIDLGDGIDAVRKRFSERGRRGVRIAEREGVEVERDTTGSSLDVFVELWQESLRRWAKQEREPVWLARSRARLNDPSRWRHVIERSPGSVAVWIARHRGQAISGIVVLEGPNDHYTHGAMIKELAAPTHANYLLHLHAIENAQRRNARWYQMGRSGTGDDPVGRFKENFGAIAYVYPEFRFERTPTMRLTRRARASVRSVITVASRRLAR